MTAVLQGPDAAPDVDDGDTFVCVLCGTRVAEFGNNPDPLASLGAGPCCNRCNAEKVIPARCRG
jgi:hypothetical protein